MGEKRGFRECKRSIGGIRGKDGCESEEARKDRSDIRKRFQKGRITREAHSKVSIWVG